MKSCTCIYTNKLQPTPSRQHTDAYKPHIYTHSPWSCVCVSVCVCVCLCVCVYCMYCTCVYQSLRLPSYLVMVLIIEHTHTQHITHMRHIATLTNKQTDNVLWQLEGGNQAVHICPPATVCVWIDYSGLMNILALIHTGQGKLSKDYMCNFVEAESDTSEVTSEQDFSCDKTTDKTKHASILLVWCHPSLPKPWHSDWTWNGIIYTVYIIFAWMSSNIFLRGAFKDPLTHSCGYTY